MCKNVYKKNKQNILKVEYLSDCMELLNAFQFGESSNGQKFFKASYFDRGDIYLAFETTLYKYYTYNKPTELKAFIFCVDRKQTS